MRGWAMMVLAAALATGADGAVVELGTTVTGNQEQPRLLFIVPWQAAEGPDSLRQDYASQLDELLAPVVRESFQRELRLRQHFQRGVEIVDYSR